MAQKVDSQTEKEKEKSVWLKPEQVEKMRNAIVRESPDYLAGRNDALIALMYDTGLRVGELVALDVDLLDLKDGVLKLPASIQKDFPNDNSPTFKMMDLKDETVRTLSTYLSSRWKDVDPLFPSRQSDRMTTESVRNIVRKAAELADVKPHKEKGKGEPSDVTPHTLRHSIAYRMLNREEGHTFYDVSKRLRHRSIQTTEKIYEHTDLI